MKKRNIFLFTLSCIFLIGILCTIIGVSLGGKLFSFQLDTDHPSMEHPTQGATTLSEDEAASIHGIDFDIDTQKMKLILGDHYQIETNSHNYSSYVEDGIWHIQTQKTVATITFLTHKIQIPAFWKHWSITDHSLFGGGDAFVYTVTIPSDAQLSSAVINVSAGEFISSEKITADQITLKVGAGEAELYELAAKNLSVRVNAGDGYINKLQVSDTCLAEVNAGSLTLGDEEPVTVSKTQIANLTGKASAGDMEIAGRLTGDSSLSCSTGDIDLTLAGTRQNYHFSTDCNLGDISIDEEEEDMVGNNCSEHQEQGGNVKLKCNLGDISVEFLPM